MNTSVPQGELIQYWKLYNCSLNVTIHFGHTGKTWGMYCFLTALDIYKHIEGLLTKSGATVERTWCGYRKDQKSKRCKLSRRLVPAMDSNTKALYHLHRKESCQTGWSLGQGATKVQSRNPTLRPHRESTYTCRVTSIRIWDPGHIAQTSSLCFELWLNCFYLMKVCIRAVRPTAGQTASQAWRSIDWFSKAQESSLHIFQGIQGDILTFMKFLNRPESWQ